MQTPAVGESALLAAASPRDRLGAPGGSPLDNQFCYRLMPELPDVTIHLGALERRIRDDRPLARLLKDDWPGQLNEL